jgi:hypothetical protein
MISVLLVAGVYAADICTAGFLPSRAGNVHNDLGTVARVKGLRSADHR